MADISETTGKYLAEDDYFEDNDNDDSRRNKDDEMDKKDDDDDVDALLLNKHQELNKKKESAESYYGKSSTGNINRQNRLYTPYGNTNSTQKFQNSGNSGMNNGANFSAERMLFKILLNKNQAGSVIGSGGSCIKELSEMTNTSSIVSPMSNVYPGTADRIAIFNGKYENVLTAVSLMVKAIGHNNSEYKQKNWDLKSPQVTDGSYDNVQIELRAVIPAASAGIVIGQAGANLKAINSTFNVEISVENKEVSAITKERLVVMKGTVANIDAVLRDIMQKIFVETNFKFYYAITNSNYPQIPGHMMQQQHQQQHQQQGMNRNFYQNPQQNQQQNYAQNPYGFPNANQGARDPSIMTANLPIPDMLVGSLVGVQGAVINEIKRSSGANISVSKKGEYIPGSNNRNLTITGTPMAIQIAHSLIINKLKMLGYEC